MRDPRSSVSIFFFFVFSPRAARPTPLHDSDDGETLTTSRNGKRTTTTTTACTARPRRRPIYKMRHIINTTASHTLAHTVESVYVARSSGPSHFGRGPPSCCRGGGGEFCLLLLSFIFPGTRLRNTKQPQVCPKAAQWRHPQDTVLGTLLVSSACLVFFFSFCSNRKASLANEPSKTEKSARFQRRDIKYEPSDTITHLAKKLKKQRRREAEPQSSLAVLFLFFFLNFHKYFRYTHFFGGLFFLGGNGDLGPPVPWSQIQSH